LRRRPRLTRGIAAAAALAGGLALCGAASAQQASGADAGLRYLSWPGRTATPAQEPPTAAAEPARRDLRRPNRVIPHGGAARPGLTPAPGAARRTLTPASAWLHPQPAPAVQPTPPAPAPPAQPAPAPAPAPAYIADRGGQPAPAAVVAPPPPAPAPADDPMAPRRDAPIFRLRPAATAAPAADAPAPAHADAPDASAAPAAAPARVAVVTPNPADRPASQGARYYSVHRQHGRQPDAVELPQPTYVDALAVTMTESPATPDLAAPEPGPTLIRDAQGRVRTQPAAPEGDYQ
jgi:hypothetical protein